MVYRCTNPKSRDYRRYGANGITVCDRWRDSFEAFIADMGERPSRSHSLDRYPNGAGNYEPGNVRWATAKEQANNLSNNKKYRYNGQDLTASQIADLTGVSFNLIRRRLDNGWSMEEALDPRIGRRLVIDGKDMSTREAAAHLGIPWMVLRGRIYRGNSIEQIVSMPYVPAKKTANDDTAAEAIEPLGLEERAEEGAVVVYATPVRP